jgi:hypothetical protein
VRRYERIRAVRDRLLDLSVSVIAATPAAPATKPLVNVLTFIYDSLYP